MGSARIWRQAFCFHNPIAMPWSMLHGLPWNLGYLLVGTVCQQARFSAWGQRYWLTAPSFLFLGTFYLEIQKLTFSHVWGSPSLFLEGDCSFLCRQGQPKCFFLEPFWAAQIQKNFSGNSRLLHLRTWQIRIQSGNFSILPMQSDLDENWLSHQEQSDARDVTVLPDRGYI